MHTNRAELGHQSKVVVVDFIVSADQVSVVPFDDLSFKVEWPAALPPYQEIQLGAAVFLVSDTGAEERIGDLRLKGLDDSELPDRELPIGFVRTPDAGLERTWHKIGNSPPVRMVGVRPDKLVAAIRDIYRNSGRPSTQAERFRFDVTLWEFVLTGPMARRRRPLPSLGERPGVAREPLFVVFEPTVPLDGSTTAPPPDPPPYTDTAAAVAPLAMLPPLAPRVAYHIMNWVAAESLLCPVDGPENVLIWRQSTPPVRRATTGLCTFDIVADAATCDYAGADRSAWLQLAVSGGAVARLGRQIRGLFGIQVGGSDVAPFQYERTDGETAYFRCLGAEGSHKLTFALGSPVLDYDIARLFYDGTSFQPLRFVLTCHHPADEPDDAGGRAPTERVFQITFDPEDGQNDRRIVMVMFEGASAAIVVNIQASAGAADPAASTVSLEDVRVAADAERVQATMRLRNVSSQAADIVWQAGGGAESSENLPAWSVSQAALTRVLSDVPADEIHALELRFRVRVGQPDASGAARWYTEVDVDISKREIVETFAIDLGTSTISVAYLPDNKPRAVVVPLAAGVNAWDPSQPDNTSQELLSSQVGITNAKDSYAPPWLVARRTAWSDGRLGTRAADADVCDTTDSALLVRLQLRRAQVEVHQPMVPFFDDRTGDPRFVVRQSAKMCVRHGPRLDTAAPEGRDVTRRDEQDLPSWPARRLESEVLLAECLDEIVRVLLPQAGPISTPSGPIERPEQWLSHVLTKTNEHRRFEFVITVPASTSVAALNRYEWAANEVRQRIAADQSGTAEHVKFRFVHEAVAVAEAMRARYSHGELWPTLAATSPQPERVIRRLVVIDIGAGTLDVCLLDLEPADLRPGAPTPSARSSYAVELGGNALDEALARDVSEVLEAAVRGPREIDSPGLATTLDSFKAALGRSRAAVGGPFDKAKRAMSKAAADMLYLASHNPAGAASPPVGAGLVYARKGIRVLAAGDPLALWVELDFSDPARYPTHAGHYIRAIGDVVVRGLGRAIERPSLPTYLTAVLSGRGAVFAPVARAVREGLETWLQHDSNYHWGSRRPEKQVYCLHELMGARHDPTAMKTVVVEGATALAQAKRIQLNPSGGGNIAIVEGDVSGNVANRRFTAVRKITFPESAKIVNAASYTGPGVIAFVPYGLDVPMLDALEPDFRAYVIATCIDIVPLA